MYTGRTSTLHRLILHNRVGTSGSTSNQVFVDHQPTYRRSRSF
jgi:hypothetical protein